MFGFEGMFDFDGDGKLNVVEQGMEMAFVMEEIIGFNDGEAEEEDMAEEEDEEE